MPPTCRPRRPLPTTYRPRPQCRATPRPCPCCRRRSCPRPPPASTPRSWHFPARRPPSRPVGGWPRCAARRTRRSSTPARPPPPRPVASSEIVKYVNYVGLRKEEGRLGSQHLLEVFRTALTARRFEERVVRLARAGEVPATLH